MSTTSAAPAATEAINTDYLPGTRGLLVEDGSASLITGWNGRPVVVVGYTFSRGLVVRPAWEGGPRTVAIAMGQFAPEEETNG